MHLVDLCGAIAATRHARGPVVTVSVDQMTFLLPVHVGELVLLRSQVNRVFQTSMEVGVKVWVENLVTGHTRHTSSAYLTFVAVDKSGKRVELPPSFRKRKKIVGVLRQLPRDGHIAWPHALAPLKNKEPGSTPGRPCTCT